MITVINKNFNSLYKDNSNIQSVYDDFINNEIDFFKLKCPCGHTGHLTRHAYYTRTVRTVRGIIRIKILRVICSICKKTHAVMMHHIIPYSSILFNQHIQIISSSIGQLDKLMSNYNIDEAHIKYIKKQYLCHWKQRLISYHLLIDSYLIKNCFKFFNRQFMQIKYLSNILND